MFPSVSAGAAESGDSWPQKTPITNTFSLQLNTPHFMTSLCSTAAVPANCRGWQQFLYETTGNQVYMQLWLLGYNNPCAGLAGGWASSSGYPGDCYIDVNDQSTGMVGTGPLTVSDLSSVHLTGSVSGGMDSVTLTTGTGQGFVDATGDPAGLLNNWTGAEFNIFGDYGGDQAIFTPGTAITTEMVTHNGTTMAPMCAEQASGTSETNNLNLAGPPTLMTQPSPAMEFNETFSSGGMPSCATADGIGDTHLATFSNLLYDFQATGDYVLAQAPGFVVQNRQVSGAPTWPNAAVNQAIAAQVGSSDVAVCTSPTRLMVNSNEVNVADGSQLSLPQGGTVSLSDGTYLIQDATGDSVSAQVLSRVTNSGIMSWIDASVGLGRWPTAVGGLLASAPSNPDALQSRDRTVLTAPFAFAGLYGPYATSWRVQPGQSLLSACGPAGPSTGPAQTFYASDLPPSVYNRAHAYCVGAGVTATPLVDPCTLDVAVLGDEAPSVYLHLPSNLTVGQITTPLQ
jgi:hypothetical protein